MDRDYFVYEHVTPDGMYYFGVTKNIKNRLLASKYKTTSLWPYIEKYGWKNIKHNILMRELTYEESRKTEDMLIITAREDGVCMNKLRSGLISFDIEHNREKDRLFKQKKRNEHRDEYNEYQRQWREENREKCREYDRKRNKTEKRKEYERNRDRKEYNRLQRLKYPERYREYDRRKYEKKKSEKQLSELGYIPLF